MAKIPYDDRDGFIWMDGKMLPWREAKTHYLTHALHYGTSVFEGERAYNNKIFKSVEHSERLLKSAEIIEMPMTITVDELEDIKKEILKANGLNNAYIRAAAWRGPEQMGIDVSGTETHIAVAAWDWGSYFDPAIKENGISLCQTGWAKPAPNTAPIHSKCAGLYVTSTIAKRQAQNKGYTDALMLDFEGYVAESTGANLFGVKDRALITPMADRFLNGITRRTIIDLAKDRGLEVIEKRVTLDELNAFEEVFLTGTAAEITPVGKIDDTTYKVGPTTKQLHADYETLTNP